MQLTNSTDNNSTDNNSNMASLNELRKYLENIGNLSEDNILSNLQNNLPMFNKLKEILRKFINKYPNFLNNIPENFEKLKIKVYNYLKGSKSYQAGGDDNIKTNSTNRGYFGAVCLGVSIIVLVGLCIAFPPLGIVVVTIMIGIGSNSDVSYNLFDVSSSVDKKNKTTGATGGTISLTENLKEDLLSEINDLTISEGESEGEIEEKIEGKGEIEGEGEKEICLL